MPVASRRVWYNPVVPLPDEELEQLLHDLESDRVERKESDKDGEKIRQAICAFANDLPRHQKPGVLFIGATDDGVPTKLAIDNAFLERVGGIRREGKILPLPSMTVQKRRLSGADLVVIEVMPSDAPPVRFDGRVWIRLGPRRDLASVNDERILSERARASVRPFDQRPCEGAALSDLVIDEIKEAYLPAVVDAATLAENGRDLKEQLASIRLYDLSRDVPTNCAILAFGKNPIQFLPGGFVTFARHEGPTLADRIRSSKLIGGNLLTQLRQLDELLPLQIETARTEDAGRLSHADVSDYPYPAIREIVLNALVHRTYEATNAPVRISWFPERIEIQNPGGLFGVVNPENFGRVSDYRNPTIAEVARGLGYVERFGVGISRVRAALQKNGNPEPRFVFEQSHTLVVLEARPR
jgi:ATP-dependent DNA helicase RecG